jgi:hypothetical protein
MKKFLPIALLLIAANLCAQQHGAFLQPADFNQAAFRTHVAFLADDAQEGRFTGSAGIRRAGTYIAQHLKAVGLQPLPGQKDFELPFDYTADIKLGGHPTALEATIGGNKITFTPETDVRALAFTENAAATGELAFAGYGLVVPGTYNSYEGLDVKDKVVIVLRGIPEQLAPAHRMELNRFSDLRFKAAQARNKGAKALLVVNGPNSAKPGELIPLSFDRSAAGAGIVALSISGRTADQLLQTGGKSLKQLQTVLDTAAQAVPGFVLKGVTVAASGGVLPVTKTDRNIVAVLPATTTSAEYVMIGAHYDHLGLGQTGSLARSGEEHAIHNGADDNASGVAAVLELAARFAKEKERKRNVIIALWAGEELGLVGSNYFAAHPPVPLDKIIAYFNFDMVGRLQNNKLQVQGVGSSPDWRMAATEFNRLANFDLALTDDPYLPTDVTSFYPKGMPVLAFFTGTHEDYHRPTDDAALLNYDGMQRIAAYAGNLILNTLNDSARPAYAQVTQNAMSGRSGGPMRVSVGTIPDYAYQGSDGMKLQGVRGGSPAEKGGMKAGDLVIEFGGQLVKNVYDYMNVLGALKGGEAVKAVVVRDGNKLQLSITPEARN